MSRADRKVKRHGRPAGMQIGGETYVRALLRATESDEDGCPRTLHLHRDDERINLDDMTKENGGKPPIFWVVYVPPNMIPPRRN